MSRWSLHISLELIPSEKKNIYYFKSWLFPRSTKAYSPEIRSESIHLSINLQRSYSYQSLFFFCVFFFAYFCCSWQNHRSFSSSWICGTTKRTFEQWCNDPPSLCLVDSAARNHRLRPNMESCLFNPTNWRFLLACPWSFLLTVPAVEYKKTKVWYDVYRGICDLP